MFNFVFLFLVSNDCLSVAVIMPKVDSSGRLTLGTATIKMLCDGFGITLYDFFNTDEFLNLEQEIK